MMLIQQRIEPGNLTRNNPTNHQPGPTLETGR